MKTPLYQFTRIMEQRLLISPAGLCPSNLRNYTEHHAGEKLRVYLMSLIWGEIEVTGADPYLLGTSGNQIALVNYRMDRSNMQFYPTKQAVS